VLDRPDETLDVCARAGEAAADDGIQDTACACGGETRKDDTKGGRATGTRAARGGGKEEDRRSFYCARSPSSRNAA
jgi:hypothetical protein